MKYEWRKNWSLYHGYIVVIVTVLLGCILDCSENNMMLADSVQQMDAYKKYMIEFEGELTEEKSKRIEELYEKICSADGYLKQLQNQCLLGMISKEEYTQQAEEYIQLRGQKNGFDYFYEQYQYVKEMPGERFLLDESGWNRLLQNDNINILLIISIIILDAPVFCREYQSQMEVLIRTCRNRRKSGHNKLIYSMIIASIMTILCSISEFILVCIQFGISGWNYPLSSLRIFENTKMDITIGQAVLIVFAFRVIGGAVFSLVISLVANISKKTIITMVVSLLIALFPALLYPERVEKYFPPCFTGTLIGNGYLWGKQVIYDVESGKETILFDGFQIYNLMMISLIYFIEAVLLYCINLYLYEKRIFNFRKSRNKIPCFFMIICISCIAMLNGCKKNSSEATVVYSPLDSMDYYENSEYTIQINYEKDCIEVYDKLKEETYLLEQDPFYLADISMGKNWSVKEKDKIEGIFLWKNLLYFITMPSEMAINWGYCVYQVNLDTMEKDLIYSNISGNDNNYYGLNVSYVNEDVVRNRTYIRYFFVCDSYLFFLEGNNIKQVNLCSGQEQTLVKQVKEETGFCSVYPFIYYLDESNCIWEYNVNTMEKQSKHIYASELFIQNGELNYIPIFE